MAVTARKTPTYALEGLTQEQFIYLSELVGVYAFTKEAHAIYEAMREVKVVEGNEN